MLKAKNIIPVEDHLKYHIRNLVLIAQKNWFISKEEKDYLFFITQREDINSSQLDNILSNIKNIPIATPDNIQITLKYIYDLIKILTISKDNFKEKVILIDELIQIYQLGENITEFIFDDIYNWITSWENIDTTLIKVKNKINQNIRATIFSKYEINIIKKWSNDFIEFTWNNINLIDKEGKSILIHSIEKNKIDITNKILSLKKTNINIQDNNWNTALLISIERWNNQISKKIIEMEKCDINIHNIYWYTALIIATYNWNIEIINSLLENEKIDINKRDKYWDTALSHALW